MTPLGEHLTSIGNDFVAKCSKLSSIIVSPNMVITKCRDGAFSKCDRFVEGPAWAKEFGRLSSERFISVVGSSGTQWNDISINQSAFILGSVMGLRIAKPSMTDTTRLISATLLVLLPYAMIPPATTFLRNITKYSLAVQSRLPTILLSSTPNILTSVVSFFLPAAPTVIHTLAFLWSVTVIFWREPIEAVYALLPQPSSSFLSILGEEEEGGVDMVTRKLLTVTIGVALISTCVVWPIIQPFLIFMYSYDTTTIRVGRRGQTLRSKILSVYNPFTLILVGISGANVTVASMMMTVPLMMMRFSGTGGGPIQPNTVLMCYLAIWVFATTTIRISTDMLSSAVFTPPRLLDKTTQGEDEEKGLVMATRQRHTATCVTLVFVTTMTAISTAEESYQINSRIQKQMLHSPQQLPFSTLLWYVGCNAALMILSMGVSFAIPRRHAEYQL